MKRWCMYALVVGALAQVAMAVPVYGDDYSTWGSSRNIILNTKSSGAAITTNQTNFPVLIRLSARDSLVFKVSQKYGQDVRFAKYNGTHFPYQIELWDSAGQNAAVWVLVDTVKANDSVQTAYMNGYMKMYWGNPGAADSSNSALVFSTTNGFMGVYHFAEGNIPKGSTIVDATGLHNGMDSLTSTGTAGNIGSGHQFGVANDAVNVGTWDPGDSITLSCWENTTAALTANSQVFISKRLSVDRWQFAIKYISPGGFYDFYHGSTGTNPFNSIPQASSTVWHHVAAVSANGVTNGTKLYIDGVHQTVADGTAPFGTGTTSVINIGNKNYSNATNYFNGYLDEVRIEKVLRTDDWIMLCYKNQLSTINGDSLTILGAIVPAPVAPTLLTPANTATGVAIMPTLTWGTVAGAATYRVQIAAVSDFSTITINDSTLTAGTKTLTTALSGNATYYWRANAKNAGGTSAYSSVFSFTTVPAASGTPTLLSPANAATNIVLAPTLIWGTVPGAATYRVQLSTSSAFGTTVADDSTPTAGTKAITGLTNSTTYYWRANSKNTGGTSAWSTSFSFTTIPAAPAVPVLTAPANAATNVALAPTLTWGTVTGAATYRVQLSTSSAFGTTVADDSTLTVGTKAITGLTNYTVYYWRANAKNTGGTSAWSTAFSFTTTLAAPPPNSPASASTITTSSTTLTWGTVSSAATYRVQLSTSSAFSATVVNDSTLTAGTKSITGLTTGTYYWRVNAKNTGGTSDWSTVFSLTVSLSGIAAPTPHYVPAGMGHNGVLDVYMANGSRVMELAYGASATKTQLLNAASKSLAKGYYTYRFRSVDAQVDIVGKLVK